MEDCIFCKIAKGEVSTDFVYQDDEVVAFKDINPIAPTHVLIIPKRHIECIQSTQDSDAGLLGKMIIVARRIAEDKNLKGYKLFFNCGEEGGQRVLHLHLHLIGGWKNLEEYNEWVKKRFEKGGVI